MGWSCATKAMNVLEALNRYNRSIDYSQNDWYYRGKHYFYEISRIEHGDGAITGSVYNLDTGYKAGSLRIEPDGYVTRGAGGLKTILNILKEPFVEVTDWRNWKL